LKTYFSPSFKVPFYQIGKMDTNDLSERFFDENTILYSVSDRNEILFGEKPEEQEKQKEETITFTPGPGVTAIVHGQDEEGKSGSDDATADDITVDDITADEDEQILLARWRMYKESNPEATLDDFYEDVSTANSEVY
jgi:hypothetical protein